MKNILRYIDIKSAEPIFEALGKDENSTRFVGGVVRDALLGRKTEDVDIASVLPPEEVMKRLKAAGIKSIPTGIKHGTVTALIGKCKFEITTLRKDVENYGRHAKVEFSASWKEDAARRDFTINGMSLSFDGKLFDYFGGAKDLEKGKVKFIGNAEERIKEDYLRILRYFRFCERFSKGAPDKEAMKAAAKLKGGIKNLSGERIQQEMLKLFAGENPYPAIADMEKCGVLKTILPRSDIKNLNRYLQLEKKYKLGIEVLARIIATTSDKKFIERWKLSGKQAAYIEKVRACTKEVKPDEVTAKKMIRKYGNDIFLHALMISQLSLRSYDSLIRLAQNWKSPEFPLGGDDLIKAGMKPGKELGALLEKLEKKWENSGYTLTKNELLRLVHRHLHA